MKCEFLFPLFVAVTVASSFIRSADEKKDDEKSEAEPVTVTVKSLSYDPRKLEIHVCDSVVWANEAKTAHTATSEDEGKSFDTGEVEPGKSSKPVRFEKEGEFKYQCKVHGRP